MTARQILLVSPREPCGATWLINCLLELGIRTYRKSYEPMWRREGNGWTLSGHEQILRKWLPVLSDRSVFQFREDVEVRWMHEWREREYESLDVIFFVRDLRDAIFSRYRREHPSVSLADYVDCLDPSSLVNRIDSARLFMTAWLEHPAVHVVRFEDYKTDPHATLRAALANAGIEVADADVERALQSSTFERAAAAEVAYRKAFPEIGQLINRAGMANEWRTGVMDAGVVSTIEARCAELLKKLNYEVSATPAWPILVKRHFRLLGYGEEYCLPSCVREEGEHGDNPDAVSDVLRFVARMNEQTFAAFNFESFEVQSFRNLIPLYLQRLGREFDSELHGAYPEFAEVRVGLPKRAVRGVLRRLRSLGRSTWRSP